MDKLQRDGILQLTHDESLKKCKSCIFRKMARKPFPHQVERVKDLLGLICTDVCGPLELSPKLSYLRVWGCEALVKQDTPDKLDPRFIKCIFVGYPKKTMGYYFYYPLENKIFMAQNAEFFENSLMVQEASGIHNEVAPIEVEPQNIEVPIRRSEGIPQAPDRYGFYVDAEEYELGDLNEPLNYKAALSNLEFDKWLEAMNTEMQSIKDNQVWVLVELPPNGRTIRNIRAVRILLAIAAFYDYEIWQMDVKITFLNDHLSEDVNMVQPEGFVDPKHPNKVCKLQYSGSSVAFLILYVDDILLMGNNVTILQEVKSWLCKCFSMKDLEEAAYILGIKIIRDRSKRLISLSQSAYLEKIIKKFRMENFKKGYTLIMEKPDYRKSQGAKTPSEVQLMQRVPYASVIGSIMYEDDTKSQTGYVFVLNGRAVDWKSAKKSTTAMSFIEFEYIASIEASMEAV
ncbi:retrotransposon protein, putative, ty1-copia subclass [Tanacetum coccineum]